MFVVLLNNVFLSVNLKNEKPRNLHQAGKQRTVKRNYDGNEPKMRNNEVWIMYFLANMLNVILTSMLIVNCIESVIVARLCRV